MDFEFKNEINLMEPGTFMKVNREQFLFYMDVSGFSGYIRDGSYWIKYKFLKEHAAEP